MLRGASGQIESPGPYDSERELSLASTVVLAIYGAHLLCRCPGIEPSNGHRGSALFLRLMTDQIRPTDDVAARKGALRKAVLEARALIDPAARHEAGQAIAAFGGEIVARAKPGRVSLFVSVKGEIDTGPLAERLAQAGVPLCLPVIVRKGEPLIFRDWRPGDPLDDRPFGLKEPPAAAQEVVPDLLFVPLAAFDGVGGRLGYGGGFYDRTLLKLRASGPAPAIGLAFAAQEVDQVPALPHDVTLDGVLTEKGFRPSGTL